MGITGSGDIAGGGSDPQGEFEIRGKLDLTTCRVELTQHYFRSIQVKYTGVYDDSARTIEGQWNAEGYHHCGTFRIAEQLGEEQQALKAKGKLLGPLSTFWDFLQITMEEGSLVSCSIEVQNTHDPIAFEMLPNGLLRGSCIWGPVDT